MTISKFSLSKTSTHAAPRRLRCRRRRSQRFIIPLKRKLLLHPAPVCNCHPTPFHSQFAEMSLPKPFSQCSLSDLAPAISADASTASARALDPATASRLLPALHNVALTEAVLLRHPLVRDRIGLKCDASASSKRAWCGMLRDLAGAAGVFASDAALLRVYHVCKECAKLKHAQLCRTSPASASADDSGTLAVSLASAAAAKVKLGRKEFDVDCEEFDARSCGVTDADCVALAASMKSGKMRRLKSLYLVRMCCS